MGSLSKELRVAELLKVQLTTPNTPQAKLGYGEPKQQFLMREEKNKETKNTKIVVEEVEVTNQIVPLY